MCNENTFVIITDRDLFSTQPPSLCLCLTPYVVITNLTLVVDLAELRRRCRRSLSRFFCPVAAAAAAIDSRVESFVVLGACEVKDETRRRRLNANEEEEEEERRRK